MDWSAVERAIDSKTHAASRSKTSSSLLTESISPHYAGNSNFNSFLREDMKYGVCTPLGMAGFELEPQKEIFDEEVFKSKDNPLLLMNSGRPTTSKSDSKAIIGFTEQLPVYGAIRTVNSSLSDDFLELRRMFNVQSARLKALEEQRDKMWTEHAHTRHSLNDLAESFSNLDASHKKTLNQLDAISKQQDGVMLKQNKNDTRISALENTQTLQASNFVNKDHFKQIMENIIEEVKGVQSGNSQLTERTSELSSIVESVVNALLDLQSTASSSSLNLSSASDGPSAAHKLQINLLQTLTSDIYKSNIKTLLRDSIHQNIQAAVQTSYKSTQDLLSNNILVCIKDMREHNEYLLKPFMESHAQLSQSLSRHGAEMEQVKLFVKTHYAALAAAPHAAHGAFVSEEVQEHLQTLDAKCHRLEASLEMLHNQVVREFSPALVDIEAKIEKKLVTLQNAVDITKTRAGALDETVKATISASTSLEITVDLIKKEFSLIKSSMDADRYLTTDKLIKDIQLQMNSLLGDFYNLKSANEVSLQASICAIHKEVHDCSAESALKHATLATTVDDFKATLVDSLKSLREQVAQQHVLVAPVQDIYTGLQSQIDRMGADLLALSADLIGKYERLLKEKHENKIYLEDRESSYNKFIMEKFQGMESSYHTWTGHMHRALAELKTSKELIDAVERVRSVEDKVLALQLASADSKETSIATTHKIDYLDINLRKEIDKFKSEFHKHASDWQDRSSIQSKSLDQRHADMADSLRAAINKVNGQVDTITSNVNKCALQVEDARDGLSKVSQQWVSHEAQWGQDVKEMYKAIHEKCAALDSIGREQREELLSRVSSLETVTTVHKKHMSDEFASVRTQLQDVERIMAVSISEETMRVTNACSTHVAVEVTALADRLTSLVKSDSDQINANLQVIFDQHLQFSTLLGGLETTIAQHHETALKAKDLVALDIASTRDQLSNQINGFYKGLVGEIEEVKYEVAQVGNKYQLLDLYVQTHGAEPPGGTGPTTGSSTVVPPTIQLRLDQLEAVVHANHKALLRQVRDHVDSIADSVGGEAVSVGTQVMVAKTLQTLTASVEALQAHLDEIQERLATRDEQALLARMHDEIVPSIQATMNIKFMDLEHVYVSNKDFAPALERFIRTLASYQAQLDSLQEEVVELGAQMELMSNGVHTNLATGLPLVSVLPSPAVASAPAAGAAAAAAAGAALVLSSALSVRSPAPVRVQASVVSAARSPVGQPRPPAPTVALLITSEAADRGPSLQQLVAQSDASAASARMASSQIASSVHGENIQFNYGEDDSKGDDNVEVADQEHKGDHEGFHCDESNDQDEIQAVDAREESSNGPAHESSASFAPDSPRAVAPHADASDPVCALPSSPGPFSPNSFDEESLSNIFDQSDMMEDSKELPATLRGAATSANVGLRAGFRGHAQSDSELSDSHDSPLQAGRRRGGLGAGATHCAAAYDQQIESILYNISTLPDSPQSDQPGADSVDQDSHDLIHDFRRIQTHGALAISGPGLGSGPTGCKSRNQIEDDEEQSRDQSGDEEDDDFVSDSDAESESVNMDEGSDSADEDEAPTPPSAPMGGASARPSAALSPIRPLSTASVAGLSGPTLAHIPLHVQGSRSISASGALPGAPPVLSGSLLTRSRLGLPPPSHQ